MLFNSPLFLFLFLPVVFSAYFLAGRKLRNTVAIIASILFYAWGEPKFIFVVMASAVIDWYLGNGIFRSSGKGARKALLVISIVLNIGILFYFKYTNFFIDNLGKALMTMHLHPVSLAKIALPIGVSFIVFEKITYVVDIFRGTGRPAPSFSSYLLYVLLFPKLLAGPIIKYHDIADQLDSRPNTLDDVTAGLFRFSFGLAKKVLIADSLGDIVDNIFGLSAADLGFYNAWTGAVFFALQIYFDFSGYSDMAIGLGRIMGFRILENFNMPYIASNFTEFWRRWHISLSTWIRDYLYIPLGGSRRSRPRVYFNLWFCFLLSGLWHGANWTFVLWGVYHGTFLIADRIFWQDLQKKLPRNFNIAVTFFLLLIGWVLFRSQTIGQAWFYLSALFNPMLTEGKLIYMGNNIKFFAAAGLILSFFPASGTCNWLKNKIRQAPWARELELAGAFLLCIISIGKISTMTFNPFLYFRF
jgi:alginate O-acetyltransferase complex protein AlgI